MASKHIRTENHDFQLENVRILDDDQSRRLSPRLTLEIIQIPIEERVQKIINFVFRKYQLLNQDSVNLHNLVSGIFPNILWTVCIYYPLGKNFV